MGVVKLVQDATGARVTMAAKRFALIGERDGWRLETPQDAPVKQLSKRQQLELLARLSDEDRAALVVLADLSDEDRAALINDAEGETPATEPPALTKKQQLALLAELSAEDRDAVTALAALTDEERAALLTATGETPNSTPSA